MNGPQQKQSLLRTLTKADAPTPPVAPPAAVLPEMQRFERRRLRPLADMPPGPLPAPPPLAPPQAQPSPFTPAAHVPHPEEVPSPFAAFTHPETLEEAVASLSPPPHPLISYGETSPAPYFDHGPSANGSAPPHAVLTLDTEGAKLDGARIKAAHLSAVRDREGYAVSLEIKF